MEISYNLTYNPLKEITMFQVKSYQFTLGIIITLFLLSCFTPLSALIGQAGKTFKTPAQHPTGMTFDGKLIWLADNGTYKLYAINPGDGSVKKTLPSPGFNPGGIAWDGKLLWCTDGTEGYVYGINPKTGTAEKVLESYSKKSEGLAFDGKFLWMLDNKNHKILKINRRDGMMHENIPAPSKTCKGLTFDGAYLWSSDHIDNMIYRIDPASGDVVTYFPANGPFPYGLCWDGKTLWNADFQTNQLFKLNLADKDFKIKRDPKTYRWSVVQEFFNYGPGEVTDVDMYAAVPKTEENQDIIGDIVYEPKPAEFVTDRWGQRFARFHFKKVPAGSHLKAVLKLDARLYTVGRIIFPERVGSLKDIPASEKKFLADGMKYDIHHPVIQKAVKEAVGDETNPYRMVRKIIDYIDDRLEYNLKPMGGWNPAPTVLTRGTGSCSEYTFIFIAMCRAKGLPARYTGSLVVRSRDKGLDEVWHRWAQVYLPGYGWVEVDAQAADNKAPGKRARYIGELSNRFLITTRGGGDSKYLDFYYNFSHKWKTTGKCKVFTRQYGEFIPIEDPDPAMKEAKSCKI